MNRGILGFAKSWLRQILWVPKRLGQVNSDKLSGLFKAFLTFCIKRMWHSEEFFFTWSCLHPKIIFCKPLEQHLKRIRLFCLGLSCTMPLNWVNGKKVSSSEGNLIFSFHLLQDGGAISYFQNIFDFRQKYLRNSFLAAASAASISGSIFFPTHATVRSYLLNRAAASIYHAL